jgi:hypothetical protein
MKRAGRFQFVDRRILPVFHGMGEHLLEQLGLVPLIDGRTQPRKVDRDQRVLVRVQRADVLPQKLLERRPVTAHLLVNEAFPPRTKSGTSGAFSPAGRTPAPFPAH